MNTPKLIAVYYPEQKDSTLKMHLEASLTEVFGSYITVEHVTRGERSLSLLDLADIILILTYDGILELMNELTHPERVLIITRAIPEDAILLLDRIPEGESVLVVNHTAPMVTELTNNLKISGLRSMNLVPFQPEKEREGAYRHIRFAVCPNELRLVPDYIPNVIDIGERFIDVTTMIRLKTMLDIHDFSVEKNLANYSRKLAGLERSIGEEHFRRILTEALMQQHLDTGEEGFLFLGTDMKLLYSNSYMNRFGPRIGSELPSELLRKVPGLTGPDFFSAMITHESENYLISRKAAWNGEEKIGYIISVQAEKNIYDMNRNMKEQLRSGGFAAKYRFRDICCESPGMQRLLRLAAAAAPKEFPVLIQGESGCGKELLAQSIHNASGRRKMPFVAVNCASLPRDLLESELFGYEEGAFTGARKHGRAGLFERASGGTLFLDEIGDMPLPMQALLLRAIQEKQIRRIGGEQLIHVDVRIICATNKDLYRETEEGRFRSDLYYRLNTLPLGIPPLRERRADISLLLSHFMPEEWAKMPDEDRRWLCSLPWPGNVRQLRNFCDYYRTLHSIQGFFRPEEISGSLPKEERALKEIEAPLPKAAAPEKPLDEEVVLRLIRGETRRVRGIGRQRILEALKKLGYMPSDAWLRSALHKLAEQGKIEIGAGRAGCRYTGGN